MAASIEDITINYEENDILIVKELDKQVLTKGAWTTIIFKYQQWEAAKESYSPIRFTIRRYRKIRGQYMQQSKFNISSIDQAKKIIDSLEKWIGQE